MWRVDDGRAPNDRLTLHASCSTTEIKLTRHPVASCTVGISFDSSL